MEWTRSQRLEEDEELETRNGNEERDEGGKSIIRTLCKKAHWGKRILAEAPRPAVHYCVRAEGALGQGVKPVAVGSVWGGKQIYLCFAELFPNQLNRLGMESPYPRT
ncbi:unnamed protein product [Leuciscus chuanchicus]